MEKLFSTMILALFFVGCVGDNQQSTNIQSTATETSTTTKEESLLSSQPQCYERQTTEDRTLIKLTQQENGVVEGDYLWQPVQSDGAYGTLKGTIKNGLIYADYNFSIEGSNQIEEMVFKLNKTTLVEGVGELITTPKGKSVIKDSSKLEWTKEFNAIDCSKLQQVHTENQISDVAEPSASKSIQQNEGEIHFLKGATSTTIEGSAIRGSLNEYQLMANAGQWVEIKISSLEDNAVFQFSNFQYGIGQDVQFEGAKDGDDAKYWYGQLPNPGYSKDGKQNALTIVVGGTRGNATYTLTVTIKDKSWK